MLLFSSICRCRVTLSTLVTAGLIGITCFPPFAIADVIDIASIQHNETILIGTNVINDGNAMKSSSLFVRRTKSKHSEYYDDFDKETMSIASSSNHINMDNGKNKNGDIDKTIQQQEKENQQQQSIGVSYQSFVTDRRLHNNKMLLVKTNNGNPKNQRKLRHRLVDSSRSLKTTLFSCESQCNFNSNSTNASSITTSLFLLSDNFDNNKTKSVSSNEGIVSVLFCVAKSVAVTVALFFILLGVGFAGFFASGLVLIYSILTGFGIVDGFRVILSFYFDLYPYLLFYSLTHCGNFPPLSSIQTVFFPVRKLRFSLDNILNESTNSVNEIDQKHKGNRFLFGKRSGFQNYVTDAITRDAQLTIEIIDELERNATTHNTVSIHCLARSLRKRQQQYLIRNNQTSHDSKIAEKLYDGLVAALSNLASKSSSENDIKISNIPSYQDLFINNNSSKSYPFHLSNKNITKSMFDYASLAHQISLILPLNDNDDENSHKSKTTDEHDNNNDGFSNIGSDFSHLYDSLVLLLSSKLEAKEGKTNSSTRLIESDTCSYYDVLGCKTNPLVESLTTVLQENEKDGGIPANKTINVTSP